MERSNESSSYSSKPLGEGEEIAEKNRRNLLNQLCFELTSISPPRHFHSAKDMLPHVDQIEQATNYIVELKERVENLKNRKEQLKKMVNEEAGSSSSNQNISPNGATMASSRFPMIEVKELGNSLEVQLAMEVGHDIMLHQVIRVLEEEGGEVVNATFSTSENKVLYTLHAKARSSRIGVEASRVRARLHELIW